MAIVSASIPLDLHIRSEVVESPLAEIFPFNFDRIFVPIEREEESSTWLNQQISLLKEGTVLADWQSGKVERTSFKKIQVNQKDFQKTHTPVFETGKISFHWDERDLLSDTSCLLLAKEDYLDGNLLVIELPEEVISSTLQARVFVRTEANKVFTLLRWELVDEFTGEMDETRLETFDEEILPDNISLRHREMMYIEPSVYMSNCESIAVGTGDEELTTELLTSYWEAKGPSSSGRNVLSKYFPIDKSSVRVAILGEDLTELDRVENLDIEDNTDATFDVDEALGIIRIGGYRAEDLILSEDIDTDADYIPFYFEEHYADFPDHGILYIDSEAISYTEKTSLGFSGLTRGWDETIIEAHVKGTFIVDSTHGSYLDGDIYISYNTVPRLEYETGQTNRSANKLSRLDVKSTNVIESNGIVVVSTEIKNLATITLSSDKRKLGEGLYGPMYFGSDFSFLTATCLSSEGKVVDDIEVTIEIVDGSGMIGAGREVTGLSNSNGEVYGVYTNPTNSETGVYQVESMTSSSEETTITTRNIPRSLTNEKFWLMQVLKCDPVYGTVGVRAITDSAVVSPSNPKASTSILVPGNFWTTTTGYIDILRSDAVKQRFTIVSAMREIISGAVFTKFDLIETPTAGSILGRVCWILGPEDVEFNPDAIDGLRRIVYEWNPEAIHPITDEEGAYSPVMPDSIANNILTYLDRQLPEPDAEDPLNNLGGYIIVGPEQVSIRARATDPLSGQTIYSDILRLKILLSPSLLGVEYSGDLPIPYGFRMYTEEHNNSNSIGGANFYTINPNATGVQQIPFLGVI